MITGRRIVWFPPSLFAAAAGIAALQLEPYTSLLWFAYMEHIGSNLQSELEESERIPTDAIESMPSSLLGVRIEWNSPCACNGTINIDWYGRVLESEATIKIRNTTQNKFWKSISNCFLKIIDFIRWPFQTTLPFALRLSRLARASGNRNAQTSWFLFVKLLY